MSDQNRMLDALRAGDPASFTELIPWDDLEIIQVPAHFGHNLFLGRIGRTVIIGGGKDTDLMIHTHSSVQETEKCYADKLVEGREVAASAMAMAEAAGSGLPPEIQRLLEQLQAAAEGTNVEIIPMKVPVDADGRPHPERGEPYVIGRPDVRTGMYL